MEIWKQDLSRALQKGRENMDLTQQELAEMIQKSTGAVGQFERGESLPSLDTLYLLIKCLGIEANDLFPSLSSTPSYFDEMKAIMRNLGERDRKALFYMAQSLYNAKSKESKNKK